MELWQIVLIVAAGLIAYSLVAAWVLGDCTFSKPRFADFLFATFWLPMLLFWFLEFLLTWPFKAAYRMGRKG